MLSGRVILDKLEHPENAELPMSVIPVGISTLVKLLHPKKAESPMFTTGAWSSAT